MRDKLGMVRMVEVVVLGTGMEMMVLAGAVMAVVVVVMTTTDGMTGRLRETRRRIRRKRKKRRRSRRPRRRRSGKLRKRRRSRPLKLLLLPAVVITISVGLMKRMAMVSTIHGAGSLRWARRRKRAKYESIRLQRSLRRISNSFLERPSSSRYIQQLSGYQPQ